ncbi:MAG TPA: hypothetical protein DCP22_02835 [Ruminococcaceae bacterium]|nr:hypothetical protein [Oscillospiraceae bacterium]
MKKICKFLTFLLVLAMLLSTVAMAADPPYTITAADGSLANGKITLTYTTATGTAEGADSKTVSVFLNSTTLSQTLPNDVKKVKVSFTANPGYEFASATYGDSTPINDGDEIELTDSITITPVFRLKDTLGGSASITSFQLDAICPSASYWQQYHKATGGGDPKYTRYPGKLNGTQAPSTEIAKGNYVDLTLYVNDPDFAAFVASQGNSYNAENFSVTTPGDSSFLAGNTTPSANAKIAPWEGKGYTVKLTGVYYVGGNDNTLKLIVTQGNYNAILSCKIDNATIVPEKENDKKPDEETTAAQPYVIISSYSYGKGDLVAGETRNITMTFRNTSKTMAVENMMVTMTLPDAMMLTSSSNSFYIESLAAEGTVTKTVNVTVKPTAAAQSHSLSVDFTYDYLDNGVRRNAKTTETISMPVLQVDRFTVTGIDLPQQIFIGEENNLSVNFVNKSRTDIYNLSAKLSCDALSNNGEEQYLGNLSSGTTSSADFYITANDKGEIVGEVIITYEDTNMNQRTVSVPFVTSAVSYDDIYGPTDPVDPIDPVGPAEPEATGFPWFWVIVGVVVVAAGVFLYLKLRKNKKESVDEDEDI